MYIAENIASLQPVFHSGVPPVGNRSDPETAQLLPPLLSAHPLARLCVCVCLPARFVSTMSQSITAHCLKGSIKVHVNQGDQVKKQIQECSRPGGTGGCGEHVPVSALLHHDRILECLNQTAGTRAPLTDHRHHLDHQIWTIKSGPSYRCVAVAATNKLGPPSYALHPPTHAVCCTHYHHTELVAPLRINPPPPPHP